MILLLLACNDDTKDSGYEVGNVTGVTGVYEEDPPGGGTPDDPFTGPVSQRLPCVDVPVPDTVAVFGNGGYYPEGVEPGTACWCSVSYAGDGTSYRLRPESIRVSATMLDAAPALVATAASWYAGGAEVVRADVVDQGNEWDAYPGFDTVHSVATTLEGTYESWLSPLDLATVGTGSPEYLSCDAFAIPRWEFNNLVEDPGGPALVKEDTSARCEPGQVSEVRFDLVSWPRKAGKVPFWAGGERRFVGAKVRQVRAADPSSTVEVADGDSWAPLTGPHPFDPPVQLSALNLRAQGNPAIVAELECPNKTANEESRPPGYPVTLRTLSKAVMGDLLLPPGADAPLIVRIYPDSVDDTRAHLFVELVGTGQEVGLPLDVLGPERYALAYEREGTVLTAMLESENGGLTVRAATASWPQGSGAPMLLALGAEASIWLGPYTP